MRTSKSTVSSAILASARSGSLRSLSASTPIRSMVCARTQNVHPRTLPLLRPSSHLDHGGNVELLHQVLKAHRRLRAHGRILRPDQVFQPLRRGIVGGLLLAALLRPWAGAAVPLLLTPIVRGRILVASRGLSLGACSPVPPGAVRLG
jgi:hypothetical protein